MTVELEDRIVEAIEAGDPGAWGDMAAAPSRRVFEAAMRRIEAGDFDPSLARSGFLAAAERGAPALAEVFERDRPGADYVALALAASRQPEAITVLADLLGDQELGDIAVAGLSRLRDVAFGRVAETLRGRSKAVRRDAARVFSAWRSDPEWSRAVLEAWEAETSTEVREVLEPLVADARGEVSSRTIAAIRRSMSAEESEEIAMHLQQALYTGDGQFLPDALLAVPELALVAARDHLALLSEATSGVVSTWWNVADMFDDVDVKWWLAAQLLVDPQVDGTKREWDLHFSRLTEAGPEAVTFVARVFATEKLPDSRLDDIVGWLAEQVTDDDIEIIAQRLIAGEREQREAARDALIEFGPPGTSAALDYLHASRLEFRTVAIEVVIAEPCRPARRCVRAALESERSSAGRHLLAEAWFEVETLFVEPSKSWEDPGWKQAFDDIAILPDELVEVPEGLAVDSLPSAGLSWLLARLRSQVTRGWDHLLEVVLARFRSVERQKLLMQLLPDGVMGDEPWHAYAWIMLSDLEGRLACRQWIDDSETRSMTIGGSRVNALAQGGDLGAWILAAWSRSGVYRPHARLAANALGHQPSRAAWLAERVPTLGLDASGRAPWKLGSRQGLELLWRDQGLKVVNESGEILKGIPSPRPSDDPHEAERDLDRLRAIRDAASWISRTFRDELEVWMYDAVSLAPKFVRGFARHPIARDIAPRVLWGMEQESLGKPPSPMRLEEEGAFADMQDRQVWPADALRPLHPADMTEEDRVAWMALFGDYEIVQPFQQLSRHVFRPKPTELSAGDIRRFSSREIDPARIRWAVWGSRWQLGPDSGRWNRDVIREWPRWNVTAVIRFHPGFSARGDDDDPGQQLNKAWVAGGIGHESLDDPTRELSMIDAPPLVFSEIVHFLATVSNALDDLRFE